jgi:hypothetical protein
VLSVLAALHKNFPAYEVFLTSSADVLIVAAKQPKLPTPDWSVVNEPAIAQDLRRAVPLTPRALEGMRLVNRDALRPLLDHWAQPNSDFYPVLDLGAERARYLRSSAVGFGDVTDERFDMLAPFMGRRVPFDTATVASVPGIPRLHGLAIGATLRERRLALFVDSSRVTDAIPALYRRWRFARALASDNAPTDWHQWLSDALAVESDLHGGTAGVADEDFYSSLYLFMNRHAAPQGAREAVAFMHGLAAWEFAAASRAADSLLPYAVKGVSWVPVDDLREGATVAKLRIGDVEGAKRYWRALASRATRGRDDLRSMLMEARMAGGK